MGDISAEPSMEDILSSIKRIIAEDGDNGGAVRSRRAPRNPPPPAPAVASPLSSRARMADPADILELSNPVTDDAEDDDTLIERVEAALSTDSILSESAAQASRGSLDTLSRLVVKPVAAAAPEAPAPETLEGLVREMLRPMLREWLDAKLPGMVEEMVAREIARITRGR